MKMKKKRSQGEGGCVQRMEVIVKSEKPWGGGGGWGEGGGGSGGGGRVCGGGGGVRVDVNEELKFL